MSDGYFDGVLIVRINKKRYTHLRKIVRKNKEVFEDNVSVFVRAAIIREEKKFSKTGELL